MSVIIALRSKNAIVVAGDSQRIEPNGVSAAPYHKVFRLNSALYAYCGLLEFNGATVEDHLQNLAAMTDLKNIISAVVDIIRPILSELPEADVGFGHRLLDVIAATDSGIASVRFFPNAENRTIDLQFAESRLYLVAGDDLAQAEVCKLLNGNTRIAALPAPQLKRLARRTLEQAVAVCGVHPSHPPNMSCCLPIDVLSVP